MASIMSSRTSCSADGVEKRASSMVRTTMPAIFDSGIVTVSNASLLTGFGLPSPTQPTDAPPVCRGMRTLNGTLRKPAMRPRIVCGYAGAR
jgi:hypothetical protein